MKITTLAATALLLSFSLPAVFAEEPATPKCEMCEKMKKKAAAQAAQEQQATERAAQNAELDKLVAEMNGNLGPRKIEAMAAIVTRLEEQAKAAAALPTPKAATENGAPKTEAHQR
jgi:cell division protein FtsB